MRHTSQVNDGLKKVWRKKTCNQTSCVHFSSQYPPSPLILARCKSCSRAEFSSFSAILQEESCLKTALFTTKQTPNHNDPHTKILFFEISPPLLRVLFYHLMYAFCHGVFLETILIEILCEALKKWAPVHHLQPIRPRRQMQKQ